MIAEPLKREIAGLKVELTALRKHNAVLLAAANLAKKYLEPDLVEPGRTVFWALVDAIKASEPPTEPKV